MMTSTALLLLGRRRVHLEGAQGGAPLAVRRVPPLARPVEGLFKSAASFGSLPGVAARTPSRAGFQFKAIKNLPRRAPPDALEDARPRPDAPSRKAKFDQLTSWLEKQDPASEIGQKLMKAY